MSKTSGVRKQVAAKPEQLQAECFTLDKFKKGKAQHYTQIQYDNPTTNITHTVCFKFEPFIMGTKGIPYLDSENPHPDSVKGHYGHDGKRAFMRISLDEKQPGLKKARDFFVSLDDWAISDEIQEIIKRETGADVLEYSALCKNFSSGDEEHPDMVKIHFDTDFNSPEDKPILRTKFFKDGSETQYKPESITELAQYLMWNSEVKAIVKISILGVRLKTTQTPKTKTTPATKTVRGEYNIKLVFDRIDFTTGWKKSESNVGYGDEDEEEEVVLPVKSKKEVKPEKQVALDSDDEEEPEDVPSTKKKVTKKIKEPEPESDEEEEVPITKKVAKKVKEPEPESDDEEEEEEPVPPPKSKKKVTKKVKEPEPESDEEEEEEEEEVIVPKKKRTTKK